jgi:hypothetical protein
MADKKTFWNTPTAFGGALTGGLMDGIGSLFTIGAQKRAATKSYERQIDFWERQNAYNTPKAQMDRLRDAGLNPALMYGKGNTGNAQNLSGVQKANVQGPQLAQSAAAGAQISLINAQRRKLESEADNIDADTEKKGGELAGIKIDNAIKSMTEKGMSQNEATYIEGLVSEWKEKKSKSIITEIDKELKDSGFHDKYMPTILGGVLGFNIDNLDEPITEDIEIFGKKFKVGATQRTIIRTGIGLYLAGKTLGEIVNPFNKIFGKKNK